MENLNNIGDIIVTITGNDILGWFFKAFAVLLSFMYLLYAFIVYRQTQVMNKTITRRSGPLLLFISFLQILFGTALVILSITLI